MRAALIALYILVSLSNATFAATGGKPVVFLPETDEDGHYQIIKQIRTVIVTEGDESGEICLVELESRPMPQGEPFPLDEKGGMLILLDDGLTFLSRADIAAEIDTDTCSL